MLGEVRFHPKQKTFRLLIKICMLYIFTACLADCHNRDFKWSSISKQLSTRNTKQQKLFLIFYGDSGINYSSRKLPREMSARVRGGFAARRVKERKGTCRWRGYTSGCWPKVEEEGEVERPAIAYRIFCYPCKPMQMSRWIEFPARRYRLSRKPRDSPEQQHRLL